MAAILVFGSTPPESLGNALVSGGMPYPAAFVLMAAMQFVPVIARRAAAVRDAQLARGIRLDAGLASLRYYHVLALPVLYQSFKLADDLAEALESRGFARPGRTFRRTYRLGRADWLLLLVASAATVAYAVWGGL
jgi:energy-coupling factor transport system permease protein